MMILFLFLLIEEAFNELLKVSFQIGKANYRRNLIYPSDELYLRTLNVMIPVE